MPSSSTSELIAKIDKLGLVFKTQTYRNWTLRDYFVNVTRDPVGALVREQDRLVVLDGVNLEIKKGDRIGLVGVNGVGKTSLCRCLAGIYRPTVGKINVSGQVRAVFDTAIGIYPELTGRENAGLLSKFLYPHDHQDREEMVREALEFSGLGDFLDMPYRTYSNGMQARLCLSLVSCKPCDLLILDEVFEGADQFFREKISKRVSDMIQRSGAALFVSHSAEQILKVCNRSIVLSRGKIVFDGSPLDGLKFYSQAPCPN